MYRYVNPVDLELLSTSHPTQNSQRHWQTLSVVAALGEILLHLVQRLLLVEQLQVVPDQPGIAAVVAVVGPEV